MATTATTTATRTTRTRKNTTRKKTMTATTTMRLGQELRRQVEKIARRTRRSFSEVAQDLIEEALRMRRVPGIYFSDEPAGREAKIAGSGLAVWEVVAVLGALSGDERALRSRFDWLSPAQIKAAMLYYDAYPQEIDTLVGENEECASEGARSPSRHAASRL